MADLSVQDYSNALGLDQGAPSPSDAQAGYSAPSPTPPSVADVTPTDTNVDVAPAAPTGGLGSSLSSMLPSWLGGPSTPQGNLGGGAGGGLGANTLLQLGLGLLGTNRIHPWQGVSEAAARGAAADEAIRNSALAEQQARELNAYRKQELGLRGAQLSLQRDIAFKPQVHFGVLENVQGYQEPWSAIFDPRTGVSRRVPLDVGEKMAGQPGVGSTIQTSFGKFDCPPGQNCRA